MQLVIQAAVLQALMGVAPGGYRLPKLSCEAFDVGAIHFVAVFVHILGVQVKSVQPPQLLRLQMMERGGDAERMRADFEQRVVLGQRHQLVEGDKGAFFRIRVQRLSNLQDVLLATDQQNMAGFADIHLHAREDAEAVRLVIFAIEGVQAVEVVIHLMEVARIKMLRQSKGVQPVRLGFSNHFLVIGRREIGGLG
ncbi:hypothetical protein D3C81_1311870 [compost metagenome]